METEKDLVLIATDPAGVVEHQKKLADWFDARILEVDAETTALEQQAEHLLAERQPTIALHSAMQALRRLSAFYRKGKLAISQGYYLVPNFPCDTILVRVAKKAPPAEEAPEEMQKQIGSKDFALVERRPNG